MSFNLIKSVPKLNVPAMKKVDFSNNKIETIEGFSHGSYLDLEQIDLSVNPIKILPKLNIASLKKIEVAKNKIEDAEGFFSIVHPKLTHLSFENQSLKSLT